VSNNSNGPAQAFTLDHVFNIGAKTKDLYEHSIRPTINDVLNGYNGTIFAYGQSGSGKTFTMLGADIYDEETKGIIPRSISDIFAFINSESSQEIKFEIKFSILEIYKENIYDLLNPETKFTDLKIKEHPTKGIYVTNLLEEYISTEQDVYDLLEQAEEERVVCETGLNAMSSRSHMLLRLEITQKLPDDTEKRGILTLIDLAGSEKVSKTGVKGDSLEEAKKINLSLSTLGNVISALTSGNSEFVPYRDSKLTRLLQDSLGGNYKTTLIVNCSPHIYNSEETISTLKFAQRAKKIKNKVRVNIKRSPEQLEKIIEELTKKLQAANNEIQKLGGKTFEIVDNLNTNEFKTNFAGIDVKINNPIDYNLLKEKEDETARLRETIEQLKEENTELNNLIVIYKNQAKPDNFIDNLEKHIQKTISEFTEFITNNNDVRNDKILTEYETLKNNYNKLEKKYLSSTQDIKAMLNRNGNIFDNSEINLNSLKDVQNNFDKFFENIENLTGNKTNDYREIYNNSNTFVNKILKDFIARTDIYDSKYNINTGDISNMKSEFTKLNLLTIYYEKLLFALMNRVAVDVTKFEYESKYRSDLESKSYQMLNILNIYLDVLKEIKQTKLNKRTENERKFMDNINNIIIHERRKNSSLIESHVHEANPGWGHMDTKQGSGAKKLITVSIKRSSNIIRSVKRTMTGMSPHNAEENMISPDKLGNLSNKPGYLNLLKESFAETAKMIITEEKDEFLQEAKLLRKENNLYKNTVEFLRNELNGFRNYKIDITKILTIYNDNLKNMYETELDNICKSMDVHKLFYKEDFDNRKQKIEKLTNLLEDINLRYNILKTAGLMLNKIAIYF
jgi:hypothetical protein